MLEKARVHSFSRPRRRSRPPLCDAAARDVAAADDVHDLLLHYLLRLLLRLLLFDDDALDVVTDADADYQVLLHLRHLLPMVLQC